MIVSQCISQTTYTIGDNKYICYTPQENRKIAYVIANESLQKDLINNYYNQICSYKNLLIQYKADSALQQYYINSLTEEVLTYKTDNIVLHNENIKLTTKNKSKTKWIIGLIVGNVITLSTTIYYITR